MAMTKSPLPACNSSRFQESGLHELSRAVTAYELILRAEAQALQDKANGNLISTRVIGYLLLELHAQRSVLTDKPFSKLVDEIILSAQDEDKPGAVDVVFRLGQKYRDQLVRAFRTSTAPCHEHSLRSSRPSYDALETMIEAYMKPTVKDHKTARKKALVRDNFRCMVTGLLDDKSLNDNTYLQREHQRVGGIPVTVFTCHILNESTTEGIGPGEKSSLVNKVCTIPGSPITQTHYAAGVMTILRMFGLGNLAQALEPVGGVHQVWNLLSLEPNLHDAFDRLYMWFEGTSEPNVYKICTSNPTYIEYIYKNSRRPETSVPGVPMFVNFSSNYEGAPPPNPQLLALHATCARVAHMSGATEFFGKLERDAEETSVLAFDGSSAHLLSDLMSPYSVISGIA